MFVHRLRRPSMAPDLRGAILAFLVLFAGLGCQSALASTYRGARHYVVGTDALDRGEGARAITEGRTAARLIPHAAEIQNHLGLAYWSVGEVETARAAFERAIELDCDNRIARANLDRITRAQEARPAFKRSERDGG